MKPRSLGVVLAAAAIGSVAWGVPPSLSAATAPGVRTDSRPPSVDDAKADLDAARQAFEAAQEKELAALRRAEKASEAAAAARSRAKEAAAQAERAKRQQAEAAQASEEAKAELGRLAAHAYANNAELGQLAELGSAVNPQDFQSRSTSLSELMRVQDSLVHQAAETSADALNAAARAEGQAKAATAALNEATAAKDAAKAALNEAAAAADDAAAALEKVRKIYDEAQRAEREREEAEREPDRSERDDDDTVPPPEGNGTFIYPSSGEITSPYGMRVHPLTGVYKLHSGTDFGASCGADVVAAYPGIVESTGYDGAYGNRIEISHGAVNGLDDISTTYNHLSAISVSSGDSVAQGELIGQVGTTGSSTGCHLHFEVLVGGEFTDPMNWLP